MHLLSDPNMMRVVTRMQQIMGGGGGSDFGSGAGGFGAGAGAGAGYGASSSSSSTSPSSSLVIACNSLSELDAVISRGTASGIPVVVDFFATWCGPCKRIAPAFDSLSREYSGRCLFAKVDGDKATDAVQIYNVTGFPTFKFFLNGNCEETFSGADGSRLSSITANLVERSEEARKASSRPKFAHFPLKESELVLFKSVQYDRLVEKIRATAALGTTDGTPVPSPADTHFGSWEAFSAHTTRFLVALQRGNPADPILSAPGSFAAVTTMLHSPKLFVTGLHVIRMYCLVAAGASAILDGSIIPNTPSPASPTEMNNGVVAFLANQIITACEMPVGEDIGSPASSGATVESGLIDRSNIKARSMGIVLCLRALANMFDRFALARQLVRQYEDLCGVYTSVMSSCADDTAITGSLYSLMINLVISIYTVAGTSTSSSASASPTRGISPETVEEAKTYLMSVLQGSFMENDELMQDEGLSYKTLLLVGTILVTGNNPTANEELKDLARGLDFPQRCDTLAVLHGTSDRVIGACKEIKQILGI